MIYDAAIIGAGPAGAHLAYLLAKADIKVALIDQMKFPRDKLCGGMLTCKTMELLSASYPDKDFLGVGISNTHVFYKDALAASFQLLSPASVVRRYMLDAALVEVSEKQGVDLYLGTTVISIDFVKKEIYLKGGQILRYTYLIGADGVQSKVRRLAGLPANQVGFCMEAHAPWEQIKNPVRLREGGIEIYYGEHSVGYGWTFPGQDSVVVGVGSLTNKVTEKEIIASFQLFLHKIAIPEGLKSRGAYIPSGDSVALGSPDHEDLCLIGDAAGLIDPLTGEGIYYALLSARTAASAILSGRAAYSEYTRRMRQVVEVIHGNVQIRNEIYAPAALGNTIATMQSIPRYSEKLIDEVILRYSKTYRQAYEEFCRYAR